MSKSKNKTQKYKSICYIPDISHKHRGYWESLGDEDDPDAYIESKRKLREVCKRKGLRSKLLDY